MIWIVNPFDNLPMEGNRPQRYWLMARAFAKAGHDVVLWTSDFSHATKAKRRIVREAGEAFEVRLVPTLPYPKNICLRRIVSHRRLAATWHAMARREARRPDVVIASTPPLGLCDAARRFAEEAGALFIADIMDAWPETFERLLPRWFLSPLRRTARRIYCSADAISAVSRRYIALASSYGAAPLMYCCNHGIEMAGKPSSARAGGLSLVYAGSFGMSYDLETLIRAVLAMPEATLDIAGGGPKEAALRSLASGCPRIRFHGYLGEEDLRALLAASSIGIVPMFPDSCVGIPYKLADYAAAGLKVVESLGGEAGEVVAKFNAGCHYAAGDVESLRKAIAAASSLPPPVGGFAEFFDAEKIFSGYVKWVEGLR